MFVRVGRATRDIGAPERGGVEATAIGDAVFARPRDIARKGPALVHGIGIRNSGDRDHAKLDVALALESAARERAFRASLGSSEIRDVIIAIGIFAFDHLAVASADGAARRTVAIECDLANAFGAGGARVRREEASTFGARLVDRARAIASALSAHSPGARRAGCDFAPAAHCGGTCEPPKKSQRNPQSRHEFFYIASPGRM